MAEEDAAAAPVLDEGVNVEPVDDPVRLGGLGLVDDD